MNSEEKKTLANMILLRNKIYDNKELSEETISYIYQLVDGYEVIKKYFNNADLIDTLLNKEYDNTPLIKLLKHTRNRYAHIDKQNKLDDYFVLLFKVTKSVIFKVVDEIYADIEDIVKSLFDNNYYSVILNSRPILYIFELFKNIPSMEIINKEVDRMFITEFNKLIKDFKYEESTIEEINNFMDQVSLIIKSDNIKNQFIIDYDKDTYFELIKIITSEDYTDKQAEDFIILVLEKLKK